ncbi:MAG: glycogen synthase GlgA [Parachlamydiaceae bacterium]|nr:glycogen synthase GlgA [Parachlamydiaceae bacterium]
MHIVHIASELAPLAKVGGLADVVLGLSREQSWKGHDVDIIIPKYDCMDSNAIRDLAVEYLDLMSFYQGEWHHNTVWIGWVENLKVYFIEPHHPRHFFNRGCFYGCEDDIERYLYFSRTAMEFLFKKQIQPDIIHLHDWQTAPVAPIYYDMYKALAYTKPKIFFTIHNIEYQGKCASSDLDRIGLNGAHYLAPGRLQDRYQPKTINLLKGGIVYSDFVTTVSPNYAKEVKTPEGGRGLDTTLIKYENKFLGILNGIDYSYWNPELDRYLPAHYSSREMPANKKDRNTLDKKAYIKKILRERLLLSEDHKPIISCITRLVPQKGIELIKHALSFTFENNGQFVLLGSTQMPEINAAFHQFKHKHMDNPNVSLTLHHQEELAHLIFAASDMFIVPSLFEPCGLTQMIALKYGSIPIVRKTGGLADTIFDIDHSDLPLDMRNGYTFETPDNIGIESALKRAIDCWFHDPEKWRKLVINGMNIDFSWNKPADLYLEIYSKIVDNPLIKPSPLNYNI